jgi:hypothetical protein
VCSRTGWWERRLILRERKLSDGVSCSVTLTQFHVVWSSPSFILCDPHPVSYCVILTQFHVVRSSPSFILCDPHPVSCCVILTQFHVVWSSPILMFVILTQFHVLWSSPSFMLCDPHPVSCCVILTQFHVVWSSPSFILVVQLLGCDERARWHCGDKRNACRTLVKKPEERRPLGRPRHRREGSIKMDRKGTEWESVDSIHVA